MVDRTKREVKKHGQSKAANALAQLKELRATGKKHADVYELKEEDAVYDEVEEEEFARMVSKRREEGGKTCLREDELKLWFPKLLGFPLLFPKLDRSWVTLASKEGRQQGIAAFPIQKWHLIH